jgi:uncharacterized protein YacL
MKPLYRILGPALFGLVAALIAMPLSEGSPGSVVANGIVALVISAIIFNTESIFKGLTAEGVFYVATGLISGLIAAFFLGQIADALQLPRPYRPVVYVVPLAFCLYAGIFLAHSPGLRLIGGFRHDDEESGTTEKILDTSVIIDGRILDIAQTNFIEGPFIIPNFVLREIQLISDSPDPVKRNRGRRGLEMLNKLQQLDNIKVKISYIDYTDTREVDAKLVKLARETGGKLITNDFNLNKVAELQGVEVLNLNSLTNALKPIVLPGEDIQIEVIKEGKDENQGIGYLEDGTMVVVENGRALLGKHITVNVTSIIQTAAGKMIFTKATGQVQEEHSEEERRTQQQKQGGRREHFRNNRGRSDRNDRDQQKR